MNGVNKVIIVGNLGQSPEITTTKSGSAVATLSVAVNKSWKDKATGDKKEHVEWIRCVIFAEGLVNVAKQYLKKGSKVYVEGEYRTRKWTDKGNVEHYTTEVVLTGFGSRLEMLDAAQRAPTPSEEDYGRRSTAATPAISIKDDLDDEVPF